MELHKSIAPIKEIIKASNNIALIGETKYISKIVNFLNHHKKNVSILDDLSLIHTVQNSIVIILTRDYQEIIQACQLNFIQYFIPTFVLEDIIYETSFFKTNISQLLLQIDDYIDTNIKANNIENLLRSEFFVRPFHYILAGETTQSCNDKKRFINIIQKLSNFYVSHSIQNTLKKPTKIDKISKIAFVYERVASLESYMGLLYQLIINIKNFYPDIHIYIYGINSTELSVENYDVIATFEGLGVEYIDTTSLIDDLNKCSFYSRYNKGLAIRNHMIQNNIDTIILHDFNLYNTFLFATRTATRQILWKDNHFEYNFDGIDKRIIQSNDNDGCLTYFGYEFHKFVLLIDYTKKTNISSHLQEHIAKIKSRFENKVILGSIGRLLKVNNDKFLNTIATILKNNPNSVYLCCGGGSEKDEIAQKIKDFGVEDRFIFEGYVDVNIYQYVLDIYLDTFPISSGEALNACVANSAVFVALYKDEDIDFANSNSQKIINFCIKNKFLTQDDLFYDGESLIYFYHNKKYDTLDGYIKCANDLINNNILRQKLSKCFKYLIDYSYLDNVDIQSNTDRFIDLLS